MQDLKDFIKTRQPINFMIVIINVLVFIVLSFTGNTEDAQFMVAHGASYTPYITQYGEYYRLITSIFLHFSMTHLFYNMLLLLFMGDSLEKTVGKFHYLIIYLMGGVAGNLVSVYADIRTNDFAVSAGASGAIFAVLGAMIWLLLQNKGRLESYSIQRLLFMVVLTVAEGFSKSGVDNYAHIGGLIGGLILCMLLYRNKNRKNAV